MACGVTHARLCRRSRRRGPVKYRFESLCELDGLAVVNARDVGACKNAFRTLMFPDTRMFQAESIKEKVCAHERACVCVMCLCVCLWSSAAYMLLGAVRTSCCHNQCLFSKYTVYLYVPRLRKRFRRCVCTISLYISIANYIRDVTSSSALARSRLRARAASVAAAVAGDPGRDEAKEGGARRAAQRGGATGGQGASEYRLARPE